MQTSLDRRVNALEAEISSGESMATLTFATGESYQIPHDFFRTFFAQTREPGSIAIPIYHDHD
jgi:hypothetical protein